VLTRRANRTGAPSLVKQYLFKKRGQANNQAVTQKNETMKTISLLAIGVLLLMGTNLKATDRPVLAFHQADFHGEALTLRGDWTANSRGDYWNDAINALIVPAGYEVYLFEHRDFQGAYLVIRGDWSSRQNRDWYNRISSIQIVPVENTYYGRGRDGHPGRERGHDNSNGRGHDQHGHVQRPPVHVCGASCGPDCRYRPLPEVTVFEHQGFQGQALRVVGEWSVAYTDEFWNDRISSILVPRGYGVIVYEDAHFRGRSLLIEGEWNPFSARDFWNDRISSLRVVRL